MVKGYNYSSLILFSKRMKKMVERMKYSDEMKKEALRRMNLLNINDSCINDFYKNNELYCSVSGVVRKLTVKEKAMVYKYQLWSDCLVYHIIHSFSNIGETYEMLTISNYPEDWDIETRYIDKGIIMVYSENLTHPDWSESGSIEVENYKGSLFRIG